MFGLGLRPLQEALNRKADEVQHEFIALGDRIEELGKMLLEVRGDDRKPLREEQQRLREQQQAVAQEINLWRERARKVTQQPGRDSLRSFLDELLTLEDNTIQPAVKQALNLMDMPPEQLAGIEEKAVPESQTPAGRLLERARTQYELRESDPAVRQREAIAFANRPGMAQDKAVLEEIAAGMKDSDPIVRELAILTTVQLHRFRAMRLANLDEAYESTQYLSRFTHPAVIPTLIEILETRRSGYIQEGGQPIEVDNQRSRMVALLRLVEWHTAEAQHAIQTRRFDPDSHIVKTAERALELFPGAWSGPLKAPRKKDESS